MSGRASGVKPSPNQSCVSLCCFDPEQEATEMEVIEQVTFNSFRLQ